MLFQVNPPLLLWTVALLASLLVAGALVALIEPLSRRTRLQRVGQLRMVGERKATVYVHDARYTRFIRARISVIRARINRV